MPKNPVVTLVLLLSVVPATGAGPAPGPPADLGALLREAEAGSPVLRAAAARLGAATRAPSQAGALPDPEASIAYTNEGFSRFTLGDTEMSLLALTWTQEVPYPGKRALAGEVATRQAEVAAKVLERTRFEIAASIKMEFADLVRLDRTARILDETKGILQSFEEAARRRYEVGRGIQESILKARTEILRLESEAARLTQDRRAAEIRLNALVGRSADTPIGPAFDLPEGTLPADTESLAEEAATRSPDVAGLEAVVLRDQARVSRARLDLKPDFTWSGSYQHRGDFDPMVMGMFGLRLPVYRARKQAQAVQEAEFDLTAARHDLDDARLRARAAVREIASRVERAARLAVLLDQGVIPQALATLESAQASFGVGRIDFLDLLNDLTAVLGARIDLAGQRSERVRALAMLEPLIGREIVRPTAAGTVGGDDHGAE